jgi:hypothetical protein
VHNGGAAIDRAICTASLTKKKELQKCTNTQNTQKLPVHINMEEHVED